MSSKISSGVSTPQSARSSTFSGSSRAFSTTFSRLFEASLARRFPRQFANEGDIVGLTISSLREVERGGTAVVMLCVDLTEQVLAEAVSMHADHIVCYSPMPRTPLSTVSADDPTGRIVLKCARAAVAVHTVHTACANAPGGVADWLAESLASGTRSPILPHADVAQAGEGRLLECAKATPLSALIARLKELLGVRHLRLALGVVVDETSLAKAMECCFVSTIALVVGTHGASVLRGCAANVYVTSEMSHAEVLEANAQGVVVLLTGQSTIERAYLRMLRGELQDECARAPSLRSICPPMPRAHRRLRALRARRFVDSDWNVKVECSQVDCCPLAIV